MEDLNYDPKDSMAGNPEDFSKLTKAQLIDKLNAKPNAVVTGADDWQAELNKINRAQVKSDPNKIPFTQTSDHKNMFLWTKVNKRIGPLHPANAKSTFERFREAGVQLFTQPRTDAQLEEFKATPEYQRYHANHVATRKQLRAKSGRGKQDKMVQDVAVEVAKAISNNQPVVNQAPVDGGLEYPEHVNQNVGDHQE